MSGYEPAPVLGLTTYLQQAQTGIWDVHASFLPAIYMEGVNLAAGTAVLLPPQPADSVERVLDGLDGVIITGGRDMDPASYGQQRHPATDEPVQANRERDRWEAALVHGAIRRGMPVLGICRGAQVVNVALGGTLHQHLPDVLGHTRHQQGNAVFSTSGVRTVAGTRLAALIGDTSDVQCYHHQAIDLLGQGLIVSARDVDGVIEAVEIPGENFVLAVQWHPEERLDDIRLFVAVVAAAAQYATGKVNA
ncbi:gamma-glutamyl-gamma-aminobutyrate hydrolase family protein [Mycolicibacterium moriokaense]|nr:gamma-glutamyl-gamma-aminobutyrate hydrolase family protein [Mycolicibacterium moriokaense]